jgi:hypothetical protein
MPNFKAKAEISHSQTHLTFVSIGNNQQELIEDTSQLKGFDDIPSSLLTRSSEEAAGKASAIEQMMIEAAKKRDQGYYDPRADAFRNANLRQLSSSDESLYAPSMSKGIISEFSTDSYSTSSMDETKIPTQPISTTNTNSAAVAADDLPSESFRAKAITHGR